MAELPQPIHSVAASVYRWWQEKGESEHDRDYLGASILGGPCERALWLSFRWSEVKKFDGRLYRVFNRGHREESIVHDELRGIGCEVSDTMPDGSQWGFSAIGGHFRGHIDGAVTRTPYAEKTWAVLEIKTHSLKMFKELTDKGVEKSHPTHYAQMQIYMGQMEMTRALYYAVCKDDDRIHTEWIHFNKDAYDKLMERAARIISSPEPLPRISDDASWYQCKFCDYHGICHGTDVPRATCRSCAHATPEQSGGWSCAKHGDQIPLDAQRIGCNGHRYIPILLANFAEYKGTPDGENPEYVTKTGKAFRNGEKHPDYTSVEIRAIDKALLGDAGLNELRTEFEARVA